MGEEPLKVGEETFSQIRQDLTAPNIMNQLRQDVGIRSKMTEQELAAMDTIIKEVGTPDEYPSIGEYVMRSLPFIKLTYSSTDIVKPIMPAPELVNLIMRDRFL